MEDLGLKSPRVSTSERSRAARMRRFSFSSVSSSCQCTRSSACSGVSPGLGTGAIGACVVLSRLSELRR